MPIYFQTSFILILLCLFSYIDSVIFDTPLVFYSQLWQLGNVSTGSSQTFSITTATPQQNIRRTGIALAQLSKKSDEYHSWIASVTAGGTTTSSFTITVNMSQPSSGMKMGYFLIVIKTQTINIYVDLIPLTWASGTNLNSTSDSVRNNRQNLTITSLTQFTSVPSDLTAIPLTISFRIFPDRNDDDDYRSDRTMQYQLTCSIDSNNLTAILYAHERTRINGFNGLAILFSTANVNTAATANSWNMSMYINNWQDPNDYWMATYAPAYGPNFHHKCVFGYSHFAYRGERNFDYKFDFTTKGNYNRLNFPDHSDLYHEGYFFCFGNSSTCGQTQTMTDNISLTCHNPNSCPLPQFSGWTSTLFCPKCSQLICQNCTVTNRSNCTTCGTNSSLSNGLCACNSDSWSWNTPISTSALGQWNNVANSLTECRYNCTAQITGCLFDKCNTGTFCTQCLVGFYLNITSSTTNQNCVLCTTLSNCIECSNAITCILCVSGYIPQSGVCTQCRTIMTNCSTCDSANNCTLCDTGYVNISLTVCQCSPSLNLMADCALCTLPTACSQCVDTTFFISTVDSMCHSCRSFDLYCITCTAFQVCETCDAGYTVLVSGAIQTCISCTTITNCILCSDPTTCTQCVSGFIPQSGVCTSCGTLMPNCVTCTDAAVCTLCQTGYLNIVANVCQCSPNLNLMSDCILCTGPTACDQCTNDTFFIKTTDLMCHSCRQFDSHCNTCSAYQVCNSCDPGYTVVTVGATSLCKACWDLFPNCTLCSSPTACDVCNYTYGLTTASNCQICSTLLMTGCEACTDSTACDFCVNKTYLVQGICYQCSFIYLCLTCFVNPMVQLECLSCRQGFFLNTSVLTGQPECKSCMHFTTNCLKCTNIVCFQCVFPYLPGSDGLCSRCETGFYYVSGICTNIAGCIRAAHLPNGNTTCLACAPELFFIFDPRTRKCVCLEGFQDFSSIGHLPQCRAVCGDGIIINQFEQCDDKNIFPRDGCDRNCKVEPGFTCGFLQPSKCILELNIESFVFNNIFRILGQNKAIISYTIQPAHPGLKMRPWDKIIKLNFPPSAVNQSRLSYSYEVQTGQLFITVPYNQELEGTSLEAQLTLDPSYIQSVTPFISLVHKLKGVNSKLIFQQQSQLDTHKNINIISLILTLIILLLFYVGSYVHKMIGLETIQVIQAIYFVRMITPSSSSSLLSSINGIQYVSSGLQNAEWIYGNTEEIQNQLNVWTSQQFTMINLKKLFLLNANFSLIPIFIALIAYVVSLVRKYRSRNDYLETKEQQKKDRYTQFQRKSQWVYDHFVFPYIMMFNLLSFFQCVSLISQPFETEMQQLKKIETQSFIFHVLIVFCTTMIYCYEVSNSLQDYTKYRMTERQRERVPKSENEKLEHDENNGDRANFHPAYVLCHLVYYFLLSISMVISVFIPDFAYSLEFTMGIAIVYFVFIWIWKPYHESIGSHNHFLKLYYGTFVLFLVICYLFGKLPKLQGSLYTAFMYVIMVLIGGIITAGFVRIIFQLRFRKLLSNDSRMMQWNNQGNEVKKQSKRKSSSEEDEFIKNLNRPNKRQQLVQKNTYTFDNQLFEMNRKLSTSTQSPKNQTKLTTGDKSFLLKKVQQDINQKKLNSIIQNYAIESSQQFDCSSKLSQKISMDPLLEQKKGGVAIDQTNLADQIFERKKESSSSSTNEKNALNSLKQKLRAQWMYMHEQ